MMQVNILRRTISSSLLILALLFASSAPAQAYTIVLRSGERIEIPDSFGVTATTLTYEVATRINRTILLNSVDISATERANNEAPGSLSRRNEASHRKADDEQISFPVAPPNAARTTAVKSSTLTNRDLESLRLRGKASGRAYELQRRELPPESRAAADKRAADELRFMREAQTQNDEQRAEAEIFWRTRAAGLREEFAGLDAELNYWRARLAEATTSTLTSLATPATTLIGIPPFASTYNLGGIAVSSQSGRLNHGTASTVTTITTSRSSSFGAQLGGRINFGGRSRAAAGRPRGAISLNGAYLRRDVRGARATQYSSSIFDGNTYGYVAPFGGYPYQTYGSYDSGNLRERIRELEAAHGRLLARRRLLEEEARRAGASPGWLRQ